jgi:hypothetical protein
MDDANRIGASFRDPSGFLFHKDGVLYRQINHSYQADYDRLMGSGLYEALQKKKRLVPHEEVTFSEGSPDEYYRIIQPEPLSFISYPYEWCFSQLKDAALLTLRIQKQSLEFGMSLKDASAYNIQFQGTHPILIDTLSFEIYEEGTPWVAYRQFCQHFLAPLALIAYKDVRLNQLLRIHIDGIPLDLASKLLPASSRLNFGILSHIHLHSASQKRYAGKNVSSSLERKKMDRNALVGLIDNLIATVKALKWQPEGTEWGDYYDDTNYTANAFDRKKQLVSKLLEKAQPQVVWDFGANLGIFSRLASDQGAFVVASDVDPVAVEKSYLHSKQQKDQKLLPLIIDLTNPSSGIGWEHEERQSLVDRGPADLCMALALVHHLAISNNLPFNDIARFFSKVGSWLVIEFVPKTDSQVQRLLQNRKDIFSEYFQECFEQQFAKYFEIIEKQEIEGSQRVLYLMRTRMP